MTYSFADIIHITKGNFIQQGIESAAIEYLLTDSRSVLFPQTSLFFALKGERRDGHTFLQDLYEKGIRNFIISSAHNLPALDGANILLVPDTLLALQQVAAFRRSSYNIPVIGITGSNGKTIVKEWLNYLLETDFTIARSPRSYNSQIGVPLSVWQLNNKHTLGIFEAGISQPDEMQHLEQIIKPTIGIFTNIGTAHSEGFENIQQKTNEKLLLFKHAQTLIYCNDFPQIRHGIDTYLLPANKTLKLFSWSSDGSEATLQITGINKQAAVTIITAQYNEQSISITAPFTDNASIQNAITCWSVLLLLEIDQAAIVQRMQQLTPVAMRLELKNGINNCSVINDSYSADTSSLKIALDFLAQQQQHDKKTVILSDILQSNFTDEVLYERIAKALHEKKINRLVAIGEHITHFQPVFEQYGLEVLSYLTVNDFKKDFYHIGFNNETILLKGARKFAFEQISRMLEQKAHQTVLEINLNAIANNLKVYQRLLQPSTKLMAMVKAFSYGSGSYEIANLLQFHKVDYLAVAYTDEGVELRKAGINLPIMVMNPEDNAYDAIVQYNLEPDIFSLEGLAAFDSFLKHQGLQQFPVHIEMETGMNRLGFSMDELPKITAALQQSSFKVQSVFSHLAASEDPAEAAFTLQQGEKFKAACSFIEKELGYSFIKHIANSAGILCHPSLQLDMVRLGIGLYGVDSASTNKLPLQEVSTLKTTIAQVKHLQPHETIGYNRRGKSDKAITIATVRLGYADGYKRTLGNGVAHMLVNGKPAPVIGTICMDMTMIDITGIEGVQEGNEVIVFGNGLSIVEVAGWAKTIPYEIMTSISQRVKRIYYEESQ